MRVTMVWSQMDSILSACTRTQLCSCIIKLHTDGSLGGETGRLELMCMLLPFGWQMLLLELEQCYYCLYGYPQKKAKVLIVVTSRSQD